VKYYRDSKGSIFGGNGKMARKRAATQDKEPTFEEAMGRLEEIVKELEEAELPLEKSLEVFEEGVKLSRLLEGKLNEAEQKVEILLRDGEGKKTPRPFGPGEEEEDQEGLPF
jgi:exodeoxyribonuclease VII small subunit